MAPQTQARKPAVKEAPTSGNGMLLQSASVQEIADELHRRNLAEEEQREIIGAVLKLCADCMQLFKTHLPAEGYGFVQALRDQLHEWFVFWGHARGCDS